MICDGCQQDYPDAVFRDSHRRYRYCSMCRRRAQVMSAMRSRFVSRGNVQLVGDAGLVADLKFVLDQIVPCQNK